MEYWNHKLLTFGKTTEVNKNSSSGLSCSEEETKSKIFGVALTDEDQNSPSTAGQNSVEEEAQLVLRGLFQKASPKELKVMQRILYSEGRSDEWRVALATLIEEIQKSCR